MAAKKLDVMDVCQLIQLKIRVESNRSCYSNLSIHRNTINYYVRKLKATGIRLYIGSLLTSSRKDCFILHALGISPKNKLQYLDKTANVFSIIHTNHARRHIYLVFTRQ